MTTIAKFVLWLLTFGAAYFIKSTELIGLATAFFALHAAIIGILLISLLLTCAFGKEAALKTYGSFLIRVLRFSVAILITSIFSFVATLLLTVDFCTAYLLTTLGQCMYNIDFVDENDFTHLKAKFKAKTNGKKFKAIKKASSNKQKTVPQTIADKKVQQNTCENKAIIDVAPQQNSEEILDAEITPTEESIHNDIPELVIESPDDISQFVAPASPEPPLKPVPDIPVD